MNFSDSKPVETKQFVSFRIDHYLMGIDILKVREVTQLLDITIVQNAPDFIWGLMNLRGQAITVLDLGIILGVSERKITPESHNIILKHINISMVVDSIGDIVTVNHHAMEHPPANMNGKISNYVKNFVKLDNELMAIICPETILKNNSSPDD